MAQPPVGASRPPAAKSAPLPATPEAATARARAAEPAPAAGDDTCATVVAFPGVDGRQRMIAEAAYYRASQRNFAPGGELEDWLAAELEIDALLRTDGTH